MQLHKAFSKKLCAVEKGVGILEKYSEILLRCNLLKCYKYVGKYISKINKCQHVTEG